jgi:hypothetical protein
MQTFVKEIKKEKILTRREEFGHSTVDFFYRTENSFKFHAYITTPLNFMPISTKIR